MGSGACVTVFILSETCMGLVFLSECMEHFQCGGWEGGERNAFKPDPLPPCSLLRSPWARKGLQKITAGNFKYHSWKGSLVCDLVTDQTVELTMNVYSFIH